jgi:hypothetical protein
MKREPPFNPLDKENLGVSVADALLEQPIIQIDGIKPFIGAGIYAIYYTGDFEAYKKIAEDNQNNKFSHPIYIGKAVPAGARKGGFGLNADPGQVLHKRLKEHASSIEQVLNLELSDFFCRYLVVNDIWIPLGESLLIEKFSPVWNKILDGFGNHDPGRGRYNQQRSYWDTIHKGRSWVLKCKKNDKSAKDILKDIR